LSDNEVMIKMDTCGGEGMEFWNYKSNEMKGGVHIPSKRNQD